MTAHARRTGLIGYWLLAGLLIAVSILGLLMTAVSLRAAHTLSTSMENTITPGAELFYLPGSQVRRGDLILSRNPAEPGLLFVRRLIGLPGDHVACCDSRGRLTVNARPLQETYLYPGDRPSVFSFSVTLGPGRVWLMGDHRSAALDSRLSGPALIASVAGRITLIDGNGRFLAVHTPQTFITNGLAPADHRSVVPIGWLLASVAALAALIVILVAGLVLLLRGRRRAGRQLSASTV